MERIGRYELLRVLGHGGMGIVYEAVLHGPRGITRPVAVKVLRSGRDSVRREARLGGLLRHRHLVDVYEVGEHEGRWFCVLELCAGGSLAEHKPLPPRAVVEVGLQVCEALHYAHQELGLVHLDLKPDNLLISGGDVKVGDLGISSARGFEGGPRVRGTPAYMAPEQARGGPVDARADVYALGMTLVELATGSLPRSSSGTLDVDGALEAAGPVADVPSWLAPAVDRCLERHPEDRWHDMAALGRALASLDVSGPGLREVLGFRAPGPGVGARPGTNLGPEPDAFVGREDELLRLERRLEAPGLVVLTGPAGIGKTRLAAAAARRWHAATRGQAWFCDVSEARSLDGVVYTVATTLDVPLGRGSTGDHELRLGRAIAGRGPALLVLDGLDRIAAATPLLERWRRLAREARLIATSRARLQVDAEHVVHLAPLPARDAAALVIARAHQRGVEIDDDRALAELAARLDGVPLALELAAGRLGVLSVGEVLERLGLSLLRSGTEGRHGTLRAALDWSWELLTEAERSALAQLSVFSGGFTAEAAESVVDLGGAPVLDALTALADHSLVSTPGSARLGLLAGVREYAAEKLGEGGAARRHAQWAAGLGTPASLESLDQHGGVERRRALAVELDNVVAACRRAVAWGDGAVATATLAAAWAVLRLRGPFETAAQLAGSVVEVASGVDHAGARRILGLALHSLGRRDEALVHCEAALALQRAASEPRLEAVLLAEIGTLEQDVGRMEAARARYEAALDLHRATGNAAGEAVVLANLGTLSASMGQVDRARECFESAVRIHAEVGNRPAEGLVVGNLGILHQGLGRMDAAREHYETALRIHREVGNRRSEGLVLGNLGTLHHHQGRMELARQHFEEALRIHREVGDRPSEAYALGNVGTVHLDQGRLDEARTHLEAALRIHRDVGDRRGEGQVLASLGSLHREAGGLEAPREHYEAALRVLREVGDRRAEALVLGNLGNLHHDRGEPAAATAHAEAALQIYRELGNRRSEGVVLGNLGLIGSREGRPADARTHLEAALRIHREVGNRRYEGIVLGSLGDLELGLRAYDRARVLLEEALRIHGEVGNRRMEGVHLAGLARCLAHCGDRAGAAAALDRAAAILAATGDAGLVTLCRAIRAEVRWCAGDGPGARADLAEAEATALPTDAEVRAVIERVRRHIGS